MKLRKALALTLVAGLVGTTVVGCGKKETTEVTKAEQTTGASKEEKTTLSVATWDNEISPQFQVVIDAYVEANPNIEIKVIDTVASEYTNSLAISMSAAQPDPDIIWVKDMSTMLTMADKEQLLLLDSFIEEDELDLSIYSGVAEQLQHGGKSYGLPYRSDWYVLYYNKDLFDAAGMEYPSNDMTWAQYYELAENMTSGEGSSKVYGTHHHTWQGLVANWAVQDGKNTIVEENYDFLVPWYTATLAMQDGGFIQSYANLKTANIHYASVFKNQQCAMMPMGTWFIATMMQSQAEGETDFNWGIATIPHPENVESGYVVGAVTPVTISAYTDEPEASWDFVKFATSEEAAEILAAQGVFTGIQTEESFELIAAAENFPEGETNLTALQYVNYALDKPLDPDSVEIATIFNEVHEMVMIKEYTIEEGVEEITRRVAAVKGW